MTRRLRQRIGGETRVRTGRFLDDLLDRITGSDDPVDVRRLLEKHRMGEVYDQVMEEIVWGEVAKLNPDEALLVLRPEGEAPFVVTRGPALMGANDALPKVRGGELLRKKGSRHGYGMVKVIVRHGELSADAVKVSREDVLRIPEILRDYEAEIDQRGNRSWVVPREDGNQLVIAETGDTAKMMASVYVVQPGGSPKTFSRKRPLAKSSRSKVPALNGDTAEGAYFHASRSLQGGEIRADMSASDASFMNENIANVKGNTEDAGLAMELQRLNDAPAVATKEATDGDSSWLRGQSVGENPNDAGLAMELQRLNDEGRLTPEDLAELAALDRDARRLETLERINMGLVNCIWCNLPICGRLQK